MYEFRIKKKDGSDIWVLPFENISLREDLNSGVMGAATVNYIAVKRYADKLNTTVDSIISGNYREWELIKDGTVLYAGVLMARTFFGSKAQATSLTLDFGGYEMALSNRLTDEKVQVSNTDSGDIAWDLINTSQLKTNGDIGITRGSHPTTVNRDRTFRFDYVRKAIEGMSKNNVYNGFDWEITPAKVFNIFYPAKGQLREHIVLDDFNIISWDNTKKLSGRLANRVVVLGEGFDDDLLWEEVEDTTSQSAWDLQESQLAAKDITQSATLISKGQEYLRKNNQPQNIISVRVNDRNPPIKDYNVGDSMRVKIGELGFSEVLRIKSRNMQVQRTGEAQIDLSFDYDE